MVVCSILFVCSICRFLLEIRTSLKMQLRDLPIFSLLQENNTFILSRLLFSLLHERSIDRNVVSQSLSNLVLK